MDLFMHIERGRETIDDLCREHAYNVNIHIFHIYDNYKSLAISKRSKQLIIVFWSWQLSLVVTASRVDKPINVLQILSTKPDTNMANCSINPYCSWYSIFYVIWFYLHWLYILLKIIKYVLLLWMNEWMLDIA